MEALVPRFSSSITRATSRSHAPFLSFSRTEERQKLRGFNPCGVSLLTRLPILTQHSGNLLQAVMDSLNACGQIFMMGEGLLLAFTFLCLGDMGLYECFFLLS